ncbi:MAG: TonB family protein [Verrucomicrobia bacterium]|nr:TonB family protein [Prolixibacteraceae bacterium]
MEAFALYLFKSAIWLTGFTLVYLLFLRNERYFLLNRFYLLAGILASIIFPLITWHYTVMIPVTPAIEVSDLQMTGVVSEPEPFPTQILLFGLYLAGVLYLLFRLTRQTLGVINIIRKSEILPYRSAKLIRTADYPASFSFFSFVFVNPSSTETETNEIVNHELEHVRQQHWIDLLLFELLCILQWMNPLCWLYGRFIRQNHEYLADEQALQRSANPAIYRAALLNQLFGGQVITLANSFNYSINKKRFNMMKNTINSPIRKLKLLLVMPLMAIVFYAFAAPEYKYVQSEDLSVTTIQDAKTIKGNIVKEDGTPLSGANPEYKYVQSEDLSSANVLDAKTIKGKVVKEDGTPLSGASVVISGKTIGTITDNNGNFILQVTDDSPIVISYVGLQSKKVTPEFDKEMAISLKRGNIGVEEVVVVGYGNTSKATDKNSPIGVEEVVVVGYGTNSQVTSIKNESTPKVQIRNTNGATATPLIVIDGVIAEDQDVSKIDPETIESMNVLKDASATSKYGDKGKNGVIEIIKKKEQPDSSKQRKDGVYTMVEEMPEFPGGDFALRKFIASSVKYPVAAQQKGAQGKVYVSFVVTKTGRVSNAKIARAVDPSLDKEAIRVVELLPPWKPGKQNGENVDVEYTVPINFVLQGETKKSEATNDSENPVLYIVEEMPEFPGGEQALRNFLAAHIKYPVEAQQKGIQGKVYVSIVVTKTGKVVNAKIARGVAPSLDNEALRVVESLPTWTPGKQKGETVDVSYTIPINFALEGNTQPQAAPSPQKGKLIIVPNPTNSQAKVTLEGSDSSSDLEVSLFDNYGKLLRKETKKGPSFSLSVNSLTPGTYLVVATEGNKQYQGHLIVNR